MLAQRGQKVVGPQDWYKDLVQQEAGARQHLGAMTFTSTANAMPAMYMSASSVMQKP